MSHTGEWTDGEAEPAVPAGHGAPVLRRLGPPEPERAAAYVVPAEAISASPSSEPLGAAAPSAHPWGTPGEVGRLVLRGGAWSLAISATGAALSLGVHLLLARTTGAEEYGRYVFALAWMNMLALVGRFELDTASVRFVGAYSGTEQWSFLRGFLRRSTQIVGGASVAIAAVSALVILAFFDRLERGTALAFLAACALLPVFSMAQLKAAVIQGLKHVARAQLPSLVVRPVAFALGILALHYWLGTAVDARMAVLLQLGATALALLLTLSFLRGVLPEPARTAREAFDTRYWMTTAAGLLVISAGQIILSTNADVLVVGSLLGPGSAGRYGAASQLASAVSFGVSAISFIALPLIADLYARRAMPQLQQLITRVARLGLLLSIPVLLVLFVTARDALSVFGPSFEDAWTLLILLGFDQLIGVVFGVAGYLLVMTGHQATAARVVVGCAALNLALTFALTPAFGLLGAGAATTITTVVRSYLLTARMRAALGVSLAPWVPRTSLPR